MKVFIDDGVYVSCFGFVSECVKNPRGNTVCGNGQTAVAINPNRGKAATAQNGVTATQSSTGGTAKIKIGKGVVHGPTVPFAPGARTNKAVQSNDDKSSAFAFFGILLET